MAAGVELHDQSSGGFTDPNAESNGHRHGGAHCHAYGQGDAHCHATRDVAGRRRLLAVLVGRKSVHSCQSFGDKHRRGEGEWGNGEARGHGCGR